jgi:flagellar biosynthesis chaperone FliJ
MKTTLTALSSLFLAIASATIGHAAGQCSLEKSAYDRAVTDYNRAEQQYQRLQQQMDTTATQGEYRIAILQGNVEVARGNLNAARGGSFGQGVSCFLFPRGNCLGSSINRAAQMIARANAQVRAQEGRLNAFVRAYNQQMTRLSQRVSQQEAVVAQKQDALDYQQAAYQNCLSQ